MAIWRICDVCHQNKPDIQTYGLRKQVPSLETEHGWTTRGAGSLDICGACWERIAKPRMRPWKQGAFRRGRDLPKRESHP